MIIRKLSKVLGACLLAAVCHARDAQASDYLFENGLFRVPLRLSDNSGVDRDHWPVSSGVPLPAGLVRDTASLKLLDETGAEIPAQFAVLSRYASRDDSIRWVLVDFQLSLSAGDTRTVYLTNVRGGAANGGAERSGATVVRVAEADGGMTVLTGPLEARVSGTGGRIFDSVTVGGERVVTAEQSGGTYIRSRETARFKRYTGGSWNTHGWDPVEEVVERRIAEQNYLNGGDADIVVEEQGPLRSVIRLRGSYAPAAGGDDASADTFYNYTVRLHFYAGKSFVKAELDVENSSSAQPQWNYAFREAGLVQDLALNGRAAATAAIQDLADGTYRFKTLPLGEYGMVSLAQSMPAAGKGKRKGSAAAASKASFALTGGAADSVILEGNVARFLDIADGRKGVTLGMRYFWQEGPRAIEASPHMLRLIPLADPERGPRLPKQRGQVYDLDFGARYLNDLLLYFHGPSTSPEQMLAVTEAFEYPLVAIAPVDWYAQTETWYFEVSPSSVEPSADDARRAHWVVTNPQRAFRAERTNYNSGGHHGSLNSAWLEFIRSQRLADFEQLEATSRWHIARNPGWAYRDNVIAPARGGAMPGSLDRQLLDWDRLAGFGPKDFYLWQGEKRKEGGASYFNNYKQLPDMEHYANFILFEYYYLTGDRRALDAINGFVNWALNFEHLQLFDRELLPLEETDYFQSDPEAMRRGHYSRVYSWMLYTTLAGYHSTGSPTMDYFAIWQIRRALALLRHRHGQYTSWDVKPGWLLGFWGPHMQQKVADHFDYPFIRQREDVYSSHAKSWMEAQNVLALHEAYKTYDDERILDALWGMADYFAHHVVFFPELGAFTRSTGMPTPRLTQAAMVSPSLHDRHIQALPVLYHYTGWKDLGERYARVRQITTQRSVHSWFEQTLAWEETTRRKHSTRAPDRITDLRVTDVDDGAFTLHWTSPADDGPGGKASRYFVKVSEKPIVAFAPTDNPLRQREKQRIIEEVQRGIMAQRGYKPGALEYRMDGIEITPEASVDALADPDWHRVDAFWMAEHVDGEPEPAPAGSTEQFVVRRLNLHNRFGLPEPAPLSALDADIVYVAVCAWDEDRNLSELSNVVAVELD